ncbi:MAG TPA: M24 family metallopeptidase, partial [Dysgonamonadaceae bacterium]|nr:M24 family metallopeptidase [Dysgonamonadaceae bacterium]
TFAIGKVPEIAYQAHQVSIDIHNEIWETAKPGIPCAELYLWAEKRIKENQLEPYFMGTVQQAKFIGHGVGLEINEPPVLTRRSKEILQPGMTIALEPKFVLPHIGAVGIENTYIVNENGLEKITLFEEALISL